MIIPHLIAHSKVFASIPCEYISPVQDQLSLMQLISLYNLICYSEASTYLILTKKSIA